MDYKLQIEKLTQLSHDRAIMGDTNSAEFFTSCIRAIKELLARAEAAEARAEKAESKLKSAVSDMNGICYLCGNGKPYLLGNATLRICDHYPGAASNKRPSCQYFTWKGMEE